MTQAVVYGRPERLSPRVRVIVQENPGPFTGPGTNTYLIASPDGSELFVLDPGSPGDPHLAATTEAIGTATVRGVLVSHSHADHWPLARPLAERFGAPVLAFREGGELAPDRTLADGERLELPQTTLEALHTPGHASDHLCFRLLEENAIFSADHVMGWSTSIIAPPDGNLKAYLASLARLRALEPALLYPGHGGPIADPAPHMAELEAHRHERTRQLLETLSAGAATPTALVERIYTDVDRSLHAAARMSLWAHLEALLEEGRAERLGDDPLESEYRLVPKG